MNLQKSKILAANIPKKKATNDNEEKKFFTPVVNKIAQENNINNDELI